MIVKKYTAATETEAVLKAKEELGSTAVVLNVKNMKTRGFARLFKKDYVEITAALEESDFAQKVKNRKNTRPVMAETKEQTVKPQINLYAGDTAAVKEPTSEVLEKKLDSIHDMIRNQIKEENKKQETENPVAIKDNDENKNASANSLNYKSLKLIYKKLLDNEVDEKYANLIVSDIESSLKKESTIDSILASVYQKIILKLGESASIESGDRKKVIFFIGPTGVGKTTTIAKLASVFKLNQHKKIGLITADTYRIAAVEQLNTYAGILDVPVNVIYTPSEISDMVNEMNTFDIIMVDTAGRSHKNLEQRDEIIEMINDVKRMEGVDVESYLVLSVTTKYRDLLSIADAYKEIEDYRLLFTKLDETMTFGNILNLRWYTNAPLSYTTSGQNVPDDIEKMDVQKLAKNLLGGA